MTIFLNILYSLSPPTKPEGWKSGWDPGVAPKCWGLGGWTPGVKILFRNKLPNFGIF